MLEEQDRRYLNSAPPTVSKRGKVYDVTDLSSQGPETLPADGFAVEQRSQTTAGHSTKCSLSEKRLGCHN